MYEPEIEVQDLAELPEPLGYKLLIALPKIQDKTKGGIIRPQTLSDMEQTASIIGKVVKVGPDAYTDKDRYPNGPWSKVGDWVLFRSYSGTRFKNGDQQYRLINDDTVEATLSNPSQFERA
jgi:co-chaperonin GroES (HSP10)